AKTALDSVSLCMPRGAVYGLVGANGAGKTTLIKHILGLLRAQRGSVRVFGLDPVDDPVAVLSRIGYLSEENDLPAWMRIDELLPAAWVEEVEEVAEHVTMISHGRIALSGALAAIKESHRTGERVPSLDEIFIAQVGTPGASAAGT